LGHLLAQQQGKCAPCGLTFTSQSLIEIDHCLPTSQGGSDFLRNKQALHRHCHDQKHSDRPSLQGIDANDHMPEEPDEVNVCAASLGARFFLQGREVRKR
jgi:RNA-directed DNA polymerase